MNDESLYGSTIFQRGFSWAVENNLLSDYKVVVLMMDEEIVSNTLQKSFTEGSELALDDVTKIIGCYKALAKIGLNESKINDQKNISNTNCYSNEGNKWRNSKIHFVNKKEIDIELQEKFIGERGRINCSLRDKSGYWRWLGIQFVVKEK